MRRRLGRTGMAVLAVTLVTACGGSSDSVTAGRSEADQVTSTTGSASEPTTTAAAAASSTSRPAAGSSTTTRSGTAAGTAALDAPTQAPATTAAPPKPRPKAKLPTGGPRGPVDPPNTNAYQLLSQGGNGCQQLLNDINTRWGDPAPEDSETLRAPPHLTYLYRAAAEACLLQWSQAKADYDRFQALKPVPFESTCESATERYCERCHQLVLQWLTGQLAAYRSDPTYAPVFVPDTGTPSPCPPA